MKSRLVAVLLSAAMCASVVVSGTTVTALAAETDGLLLVDNEEIPAITAEDGNKNTGDSAMTEDVAESAAAEDAGVEDTDVPDSMENTAENQNVSEVIEDATSVEDQNTQESIEDSATEVPDTAADDVDSVEEISDSTDETTIDVGQDETTEVTTIAEDEAEMSSSLTAFEATGDGTKSNPWKISQIGDLNGFAAKAEDGDFDFTDCYVELTKDITVPSGTLFTGVRNFNGTFDGNGHTISGLTIKSEEENVGFFRQISSEATIQDLNLANVKLVVTSSTTEPTYQNTYVGILVGTSKSVTVTGCNISGTFQFNKDDSYRISSMGGYIGRVYAGRCTINNSIFDGTIDTGEYILIGTGGFVGYLSGECTMNSSVAKGIVAADGTTGGLVGVISDDYSTSSGCRILDCRNEATIKEYEGKVLAPSGGLVGRISVSVSRPNREITRCVNTGNVTGTGYEVGGLVGRGKVNITESVNEGDVTGMQSCGGLIGEVSDSGGEGGVTIKNSYNWGAVTATKKYSNIGLLVGFMSVGLKNDNPQYQIVNCYANPSGGDNDQSGLVGYLNTSTSFNYGYKMTLTNLYSPSGNAFGKTAGGETYITQTNVKQLSAAEMKQQSSFAGFDFNSTWKMSARGPILAWETKTVTDQDSKFTGWKTENGVEYWYENGVKQGTTGRGKEIYDPDSDAWYWLDAVDGGKKAVSKDVYQESSGGKWVRYDENGHMIKGWDTNENGTYYFDLTTGAMQKGKVTIDGLPCWFDENTGIGKNLVWEQVKGQDYYWYENGQRQGYDPKDSSYRGKEIFDPAQNAWFWLDNNAQGKKAVSKEVYQPYTIQGKDNVGKWVRYDNTGRMIKGWYKTSDNKTYYYDPTTGAMTKGSVVIDGQTYSFNRTTGCLQFIIHW